MSQKSVDIIMYSTLYFYLLFNDYVFWPNDDRSVDRNVYI
jgi:hypothetical protein